ncbi:MAG: VOC family protein [Bacteroidales bacterium]|nr:VOC family protein [Bacteroidales bacterium]
MELKSLTPNLMVKDVNKTLDFYTNVLGFELLQTVPEKGTFDWGFVKLGNVMLMFQKDTSIKAEYKELENYEKGGAFTLYIQVEELQKWYETIKDKTKVIKPWHKTFYGANEFAIIDINGFILTFSDILE